MKSFFQGLSDSISVRFFHLKEWIIHIFTYLFRSPKYLIADICLVLSYFFKSPYRIVRQWDEAHTCQVGPYGEIPLSEMEQLYRLLLKDEPIRSMTDLGAGRGRLALWAAATKGWKVQAIECIPQFCKKAKKIVDLFNIENMEVIERDFSKCPIEERDLVFINPGDMDMEAGKRLISLLLPVPTGCRVVTVGFSLTELAKEYQFEGAMTLRCPWGEELAIVQRKISL